MKPKYIKILSPTKSCLYGRLDHRFSPPCDYTTRSRRRNHITATRRRFSNYLRFVSQKDDTALAPLALASPHEILHLEPPPLRIPTSGDAFLARAPPSPPAATGSKEKNFHEQSLGYHMRRTRSPILGLMRWERNLLPYYSGVIFW
ncbi:restriction of telomere capping protein 1 [Striga asiatica]|uniref:Restriction of telomere capping protein 1 n=1 Tax=Striga asiatica TaxID=4170 RepID=A0A5A7PZ29_STRAF|nr:restriction of telomere capping protein 1 [Striga asiatica]